MRRLDGNLGIIWQETSWLKFSHGMFKRLFWGLLF